MIELLIDKVPSFAPAWKDYSTLLEGKERLIAIEKGLEQNSDIETKGTLLINKALVMSQNGNFKEASELLTNVIFDTNSTFGNIEMAKFVLNNITENRNLNAASVFYYIFYEKYCIVRSAKSLVDKSIEIGSFKKNNKFIDFLDKVKRKINA